MRNEIVTALEGVSLTGLVMGGHAVRYYDLRACLSRATKATAQILSRLSTGRNGNEPPGPTRQPNPLRAGDPPPPTPAPEGTTRPRLCCSNLRNPPEITSHHVTALCPLDLRHETREKNTSRSSRPYGAWTYVTPP